MGTPLTPALLAEWHWGKNILTPDQVTLKSSKSVWWKCKTNPAHEWEARIANRAKGSGCPYCSGKKVFPGETDLATTHPLISAQWHPTKNGEVLPTQVSAGSNKTFWWLCDVDSAHEWDAQPNSRKNGQGCPFCAGKRVIASENSLEALFPLIAAQLHPTKNDGLCADEVHAQSSKKVWWLCDEDPSHEWDVAVYARTVGGNGCPFCGHRKLHPTSNSLAILQPILAAELHPTKNGNLSASDILNGSNTLRWWLDKYNHAWEATPGDRIVLGHGCPYCTNQKVLISFNDLPTTHPKLSAQWHPAKNAELKSYEISAGSHKKVWWSCDVDETHEWEATVYSRSHGAGCPTCAAQNHNFVSQPETELYNFLTRLGFDVEQSNRSVLKGITAREIDLYIPAMKFGIEFNGLYWHSESVGKGKEYHHSKYLASKTAGIQLLQVWEDDWRDRKAVILRAIAHKLGATSKVAALYPELNVVTDRLFARKTTVSNLTTGQAQQFLEANHVQGFANGSYYLGLQDEQEQTRAVLVLKQEAGTSGKTLNIVRYATSGTIVGGFTKLLKYAAKTYQPDDFITFADHCISDGGLYENNGFIADKELSPDYMYVVKGERKHKFGYRLKRFRDDPALLWDENMSERELAQLNSIPRIWDAGKTRYRYTT